MYRYLIFDAIPSPPQMANPYASWIFQSVIYMGRLDMVVLKKRNFLPITFNSAIHDI
jgi:hypothetical protein